MNLKLMGRRLNRFIPSTRFHHIPFKRFSLKLEYALWGGLRPSLSFTQFYWESYWNFSADEQYQEKCEFFLTISLWIIKKKYQAFTIKNDFVYFIFVQLLFLIQWMLDKELKFILMFMY